MTTVSDNSASAKNWQRIAFVGNSLTDGNTWPYLFRQALTDAGRPAPFLINAAGGGDVAADNLRRFDWAVLRFEPDLAIFLIGPDNAGKHMTDAEYQAAMEEMIRKVQAKGATVMLLVGRLKCPTGVEPTDMKDAAKVREIVGNLTAGLADAAKGPDAGKKGADQIQRDLARTYNCLLCDMKPALLKSLAQGVWLWEPDRLHYSVAGYRAVARAVLDTLGYQGLPVPAKLNLAPLPGLVTPWKIRAAKPEEAVLNDVSVLQVQPDDTWKNVELPEKEALDSWWPDQIRQEGYAMALDKRAGKAKRYIGVATVRRDKAVAAFLNTGGALQSVWLNGKQIFKADLWIGYHIGAKRIAVDLLAGDNRIVIESGPEFALTVTPNLLW